MAVRRDRAEGGRSADVIVGSSSVTLFAAMRAPRSASLWITRPVGGGYFGAWVAARRTKAARSALCCSRDGSWTYIMCPAS